MSRTILRALPCVVFLAMTLELVHVQSQVTRESATPSIKDFFESLVKRSNRASPTSDEAMLKVADQVPGARPADIIEALPWIREVLAGREDSIKLRGAFVLVIVGHRSDSAELLGDYLGDIAKLLDSPALRLQSMAVEILGEMRPKPPTGAVAILVRFAKRSDRDPLVRASALSFALGIESENAETIAATEEFLSMPLDPQPKQVVLNGIANSHTKNPRLADALARSLDDPNEGTRFTAAQAFQRMPKESIRREERLLQRVKESPGEAQDVRNAAKEALRMLETKN